MSDVTSYLNGKTEEIPNNLVRLNHTITLSGTNSLADVLSRLTNYIDHLLPEHISSFDNRENIGIITSLSFPDRINCLYNIVLTQDKSKVHISANFTNSLLAYIEENKMQ